MVLPFVSQTMVFTNFQLNRDFISENLCVNQDTDLNCNGTCQLVKAIDEPQNERSPYTPNSKTEVKDLQWLCSSESNGTDLSVHFEIRVLDSNSKTMIDNHLASIFRPPQNLV